MNNYRSCFANTIEKFVAYRKASGSWNEDNYGRNILYFDRYCAEHYPGQSLNQEMIDCWCRKRETETNTSCATRTLVIRAFVNYLNARGFTDATLPPHPKRNGKTYIPHAFSEKELHNFFEECDRVVSNRPEQKYRMKEIVCPALFRLLYSSGMRTTEARYLKRDDVDLVHGVINIRKSKGYDQHFVSLHKSMTELLQQYDRAANSITPNRTFFFEGPNGKNYSRQWVTQTFKRIWQKANGSGNNAVAYDLRHHYAVTNINQWAGDPFEFSDKLNILSKSMGHKNIESTMRYYHIVPGLADILIEKTEKRLNEILPEVPYEKVD